MMRIMSNNIFRTLMSSLNPSPRRFGARFVQSPLSPKIITIIPENEGGATPTSTPIPLYKVYKRNSHGDGTPFQLKSPKGINSKLRSSIDNTKLLSQLDINQSKYEVLNSTLKRHQVGSLLKSPKSTVQSITNQLKMSEHRLGKTHLVNLLGQCEQTHKREQFDLHLLVDDASGYPESLMDLSPTRKEISQQAYPYSDQSTQVTHYDTSFINQERNRKISKPKITSPIRKGPSLFQDSAEFNLNFPNLTPQQMKHLLQMQKPAMSQRMAHLQSQIIEKSLSPTHHISSRKLINQELDMHRMCDISGSRNKISPNEEVMMDIPMFKVNPDVIKPKQSNNNIKEEEQLKKEVSKLPVSMNLSGSPSQREQLRLKIPQIRFGGGHVSNLSIRIQRQRMLAQKQKEDNGVSSILANSNPSQNAAILENSATAIPNIYVQISPRITKLQNPAKNGSTTIFHNSVLLKQIPSQDINQTTSSQLQTGMRIQEGKFVKEAISPLAFDDQEITVSESPTELLKSQRQRVSVINLSSETRDYRNLLNSYYNQTSLERISERKPSIIEQRRRSSIWNPSDLNFGVRRASDCGVVANATGRRGSILTVEDSVFTEEEEAPQQLQQPIYPQLKGIQITTKKHEQQYQAKYQITQTPCNQGLNAFRNKRFSQ
ncbi:hypothetical protein FGO68_gene12965 [Halteria grandinella]|uniref:Uncharacterized protein n=1 Tax=Halteria grandinella TaxID=5974 RepID=A0A8J8T406_HALGN|nr:hypothetical protein FGO68_gene12965 [Halteria grandinella]